MVYQRRQLSEQDRGCLSLSMNSYPAEVSSPDGAGSNELGSLQISV
jgi:hypothetical protein